MSRATASRATRGSSPKTISDAYTSYSQKRSARSQSTLSLDLLTARYRVRIGTVKAVTTAARAAPALHAGAIAGPGGDATVAEVS